MLTARIMHECVRKLLAVDPSDEESLECLCRLVTTVGQNLDIETKSRLATGPVQGLCDMSNYFKEMNKLVLEERPPPRSGFCCRMLFTWKGTAGKREGRTLDPASLSVSLSGRVLTKGVTLSRQIFRDSSPR